MVEDDDWSVDWMFDLDDEPYVPPTKEEIEAARQKRRERAGAIRECGERLAKGRGSEMRKIIRECMTENGVIVVPMNKR